jgi:hypothetical protein
MAAAEPGLVRLPAVVGVRDVRCAEADDRHDHRGGRREPRALGKKVPHAAAGAESPRRMPARGVWRQAYQVVKVLEAVVVSRRPAAPGAPAVVPDAEVIGVAVRVPGGLGVVLRFRVGEQPGCLVGRDPEHNGQIVRPDAVPVDQVEDLSWIRRVSLRTATGPGSKGPPPGESKQPGAE